MEPESIIHPFPPLFGAGSDTLILGSFPSVRSREAMFFYGHPQNRFWRVLAAVYSEAVPVSVDEKKALVLRHGLALWDSVRSCTVTGSSDGSVKNIVPNDIGFVIANSRIERIFCNGALSYSVYEKHIRPAVGIEAVKLPSTSPANAAYSLEKLVSEWMMIDKKTSCADEMRRRE